MSIITSLDQGFLGNIRYSKSNDYKRVIVHKFVIYDFYDMENRLSEVIWDWKQSEIGKWVMKKSVISPSWQSQQDMSSLSHKFIIFGYFEGSSLTEWALRFGVGDTIFDK